MKSKYIYLLIFLVVLCISVGYAAINQNLTIANLASTIRVKSDIRVTGFMYTSATNDGRSSYEEYNKESVFTTIELPNDSSSVTYKVTVTNIGNTEMGIFEINNLPENLEISYKDYSLKEKICNNENACSNGIIKVFYITIKYANNGYDAKNIAYNLNLNVDFRNFHTITYKNITNNNYPTDVISGGNISFQFKDPSPPVLGIEMNNIQLSSSEYSYVNNVLTINNITGNLVIREPEKLYNIVSLNAKDDSSINFSTAPTTDTSGKYIRSGTENDQFPIYYYRGSVTDNNVLFANNCWKIVRSTNTGGTKLLYSGTANTEYASHLISQEQYINVVNSETYPYSFDESTLTWTSTNKDNSSTGEISFSLADGDYLLNYTVSAESADYAYVYLDNTQEIKVGGTSAGNTGKVKLLSLSASNIIKVQYKTDSSGSAGTDSLTFSISKIDRSYKLCTSPTPTLTSSGYNSSASSPTNVGYMYGSLYSSTTKTISKGSKTVASYKTLTCLGKKYSYGSSVTYDTSTNQYTVNDPVAVKNCYKSDYQNKIKDKYTCWSEGTTTCSTVYYIIGGAYAAGLRRVELTGGSLIEDKYYNVGSSYTINSDGSYTLNNSQKVIYPDIVNYSKHYTCADTTSTTCTDLKYIFKIDPEDQVSTMVTYLSPIEKMLYGNDVEYNGGVYTLKDTISSDVWHEDYSTIASKYHYTCLNDSNSCATVYYTINATETTNSYLTFTGGTKIENAMAGIHNNSTSSSIKTRNDNWYQSNLNSYTNMLEDTVWCNDRNISSGPLVSKDASALDESYFAGYKRFQNYTPSLSCSNANDKFTVNSSNGNGMLTYPIGLLTVDEILLAGTSSYLGSTSFYTMTPASYNGSAYMLNSNLSISTTGASLNNKPSIALTNDTKVISGDGSATSPYVIYEIN